MLELSELDEISKPDESNYDKNNKEPTWYMREGDNAREKEEDPWETTWWHIQGEDTTGCDENEENKEETNNPPGRGIEKKTQGKRIARLS